jgi:pSer/pThr/pTyr-binding forkhead associated (FHA) protein
VTSYLLSFLRRKFATVDGTTFERLHPHDWLVWEAEALPGGGEEALAIALSRNPRRPYLALGHGPECDIVLDDASLSRVHLVLVRVGPRDWALRNADGSAGTRLNGRAIDGWEPRPLASGDRIRAGDVRLTFLAGADLLRRFDQER